MCNLQNNVPYIDIYLSKWYLNNFIFKMCLELEYANIVKIKMSLESHVVFTSYWISDWKSPWIVNITKTNPKDGLW